MARERMIKWLPAVLLVTGMCVPAIGQESERGPGVSLGGPFGVLFGGGRGLRIGGPNGVQIGGGLGARFGGDNGAQFGGGEGVRIGPRDYDWPRRLGRGADAEEPTDEAELPGRFIQPGYDQTHSNDVVLHYPADAGDKLRIRLNGQTTELYPGDTIAVPSAGRGVAAQMPRPIGGFGWRRTLSPGSYVLQPSGRGWTISEGEIPVGGPERSQQDQEPQRLDVEDEAEELPTPGPVGLEASDQGRSRGLFRRRR